MMPNGTFGSGGPFAWPDSLVLGTAMYNWRTAFNGLPEEVKAYLSEHEQEIHSAEDVKRLIEICDLKK